MPILPKPSQSVRVVSRLRGEPLAKARKEARENAVSALKEACFTVPALIGVLVVYDHRRDLFDNDLLTFVRIVTVVLLVVLGYAVAREIGRILAPFLVGRLDQATAGTIGFLIRLVGVIAVLVLALRFSGIPARTLAVGGAFTAVVVGLAAQQTLGNLFAGMVLISARPFRVGERVRMQAGALAGTIEGTVAQLGLLYVVLRAGDELISVPNNLVIGAAITPLREPDAVDFRARLRPGVRPSDVQRLLSEEVTIATRTPPHIDLEEVDDDDTIVRVRATPVDPDEGWRLADEVLATVARLTRDELTVEHVVGQRDVEDDEDPAPRVRRRASAFSD